jgi:hypothetical protein
MQRNRRRTAATCRITSPRLRQLAASGIACFEVDSSHYAVLKLVVAALFSAWIGCAAVRPWQREHLAKPCMRTAASADPLAQLYRAKVLESTTGGGLPGSAPGGGCGCTQ